MDDELEEIRKRKMEQLKKQYMHGGNDMNKNMPDTPLKLTDEDFNETVEFLKGKYFYYYYLSMISLRALRKI